MPPAPTASRTSLAWCVKSLLCKGLRSFRPRLPADAPRRLALFGALVVTP